MQTIRTTFGNTAFQQAIRTTFGKATFLQAIRTTFGNATFLQTIRTTFSDATFLQAIRATFGNTAFQQAIRTTFSDALFDQPIRTAFSDHGVGRFGGKSVEGQNRKGNAEDDLAFHDFVLRGVIGWYGADVTPGIFYENFIDVMVNIDADDGSQSTAIRSALCTCTKPEALSNACV